jgi:hypothetical protein
MIPRTLLAAVLAGGLLAVPGGADEPRREPPPPSAAKLVSILQDQRVTFDRVTETALFDLLQQLADKYEVTFVIRDDLFREAGRENVREAKLDRQSMTRLQGFTLHRLLSLLLAGLDAAYLVRNDCIEIVPREFALKEAGLTEALGETAANDDRDPVAAVRAQYRTRLPLVCVVVEGRSLGWVFETLARVYDLNVVVHPSARAAVKKTTVTEQLLNVPADTALEVLAGLADGGGLTVVRRGNTFVVTAAGGV